MRYRGLACVLVGCLLVLSIGTASKKIAVAATPMAVTALQRPTLIIDAGHGGFDGGAVAEDGTLEKDLNLQIALLMEAQAKLLGFQTVMVRKEDVSTENGTAVQAVSRKVADMKNRLLLMQSYSNGIFVSIHQNKYTTSQPSGTQVFYAPKISQAEVLANCIQTSVSASLQPQNHRSIKAGTKDTYLLYNASIPAVIVECGFMSHPKELEQLKDKNYQQQMALSIVTGILYYYTLK